MKYCDKLDLQNRLPSEDIAQLSGNNDDLLDSLIEDASVLVDAYIGMVYTTPLSIPVPLVIQNIVLDLVIYNLMSRAAIPLWKLTDDGQRENSVIVKRYNDAIRFLEGVRDKKIGLPIALPNDSGGIKVVAKESRFSDINW